jgi:ribosomal protein L11 methyltransferase
MTAASSPSSESWIEIVARVAREDSEVVADVLGAFAPDGVSMEPAIRTVDSDNFAYEYLDEPTVVRACVREPFDDAQRQALEASLATLVLSAPLPPLEIAPVRMVDWAEEWKQFFHVLRVGRFVVQPSWERAEVREGDLVIDLDPGRAFGTGQHETTRLCLAALGAHLQPGMRVIDVGTGSGILAIGAILLGASHVWGVDIDEQAVDVARENVERNGVASQVSLEAGSVGASWPWPEPPQAELVVANISSIAAVKLMADCVAPLPPGGLWIGSGFIESARATIEEAVRAAGLRPIAVTEEADWRCLVAVNDQQGA